jgi:hypothetical protein
MLSVDDSLHAFSEFVLIVCDNYKVFSIYFTSSYKHADRVAEIKVTLLLTPYADLLANHQLLQ